MFVLHTHTYTLGQDAQRQIPITRAGNSYHIYIFKPVVTSQKLGEHPTMNIIIRNNDLPKLSLPNSVMNIVYPELRPLIWMKTTSSLGLL